MRTGESLPYVAKISVCPDLREHAIKRQTWSCPGIAKGYPENGRWYCENGNPKGVVVVTNGLPKSAAGKILKREIRNMFAGR